MSFTLRAKRLLVGAATGALVLSLLPAGIAAAGTDEVCENAPDAGFTDVVADGFHTANINCMSAYGVGKGRADGSYGVFANLTRGQAATLLVDFALTATAGAIAQEIDGDLAIPFTDIAGTTHQTSIEILYRLNLISGTSPTTFSPNASITRVQFATILFNAHEALGVPFADEYDNPFTDTSRAEAIALAGEGVLSGTSATTFSPFANVRRGQTATLLAESAGVLDDLGIWVADRLPGPAAATGAPELVSVSVINQTATQVAARFQFDETIAAALGENPHNGFELYRGDFNGTITSADPGSVVREPGNSSAVRAIFPRSAWDQATTVGVYARLVQNLDGVPNYSQRFDLQAVTYPGNRTDDVDLVSIGNVRDVVLTAGSESFDVDVTFDDDASAIAAGNFGILTSDGTSHAGSAVVYSAAGTVATVTIDIDVAGLDADLLAAVVAADADARAGVIASVASRGYVTVGSRVHAVDITGAATPLPDLVSVSLDMANHRIEYTFDADVSADQLDPGTFGAVNLNGIHYGANSVTRPSVSVIRAQFDVGRINKAIVGAYVEAGAVTGVQGGNAPGSIGIAQTFAAGETIGPRLTGAKVAVTDSSVDVLTNEVTVEQITATFTFDKTVTTTSFIGEFGLIGEDGNRIRLASQVSVVGQVVAVCTAPGTSVTVTCVIDANEAGGGNTSTAERRAQFESLTDAVIADVLSYAAGGVVNINGTAGLNTLASVPVS